MTRKPRTLGELEKAVYESRWEDGLLDVLAGIGVIAVGFSWEAGIPWAGPLVVPVLLVAWTFLRSSLVDRRTGQVTFSRDRREQERKGTQRAATLGSGLLLLFLGAVMVRSRGGAGPSEWVQTWVAALPVGLLALMALLVAAMLGLRRFLFYAGALVAIGFICTPLGLEPGTQILLAGAVISVSGVIIFFRFLSDHSVLGDLGEAE